MTDILKFSDRAAFRSWLEKNQASDDGVWLLFEKKKVPTTLSANDALEEALCFGWIDGQMQSIDEIAYKKYFSKRREKQEISRRTRKTRQDD